MKRYFNFTLFLVLSIMSHAQIEISTPKIVPISPNAASLGIFGDIPVGHYTGTPDISIPLYEIDLDGLKVPISLIYHASGVKASQNASWVGMGWALNAGGCVVKNIQGWDDFESNPTGYFSNNRIPENDNGPFIFVSGPNFSEYLDAINNRTDACPDIYSFNFCSYSGTCFFPRMTENPGGYAAPQAFIRNSKVYLHIVKQGNKILITDGNGFKFYFGSKEITKIYSAVTSNKANNYLDYINNKAIIPVKGLQDEVTTAWCLDSIVSPRRNKISFLYKDEEMQTPVSLSESAFELLNIIAQAAPFPPGRLTSSSYTYSTIKQKSLSRIYYNNLSIEFQTTDRQDIEPVIISERPQKLSGIIIKNGDEIIKRIGMEYLYTGTLNNYNNCRLFLKELYELPDGQTHDRKYSFSYINPEQLPNKTTTLIDYWGYAKDPSTPLCYCWSSIYHDGNQLKSRTLIPPTMAFSNMSPKFFYGQNRSPDASMLTLGALNLIQYPTGGKTVFTYEPHEYDNVFSTGTEREQVHTLSFDDVYMYSPTSIDTQDCFAGGELRGDTFSINASKVVKVQMKIEYMVNEVPLELLYHGYRVSIQKKAGNSFSTLYTHFFPDVPTGASMPQWSDWQFTLEAGTYRLSLERAFQFSSLPSTEYQAQGEAKLTLFTGVPVECNIGAGIRIKEISNEMEDQPIQKRRFIYDYGLLMSQPKCHYTYLVTNYAAQYLLGTSSSMIPTSSSAAGALVGYGHVKEEIWDSTFKGATHYYFRNTVDEIPLEYWEVIPDLPLIVHADNGLLDTKQYVNAAEEILREESYSYSYIKQRSAIGLKMYAPPMGNQRFGVYYYTIPSEWWKLDKQTAIDYYGNTNHTETIEYTYNPVNYLPSSIKKTGSDGRILNKTITYANSSNSGILGEMQTSHLFNLPVVEGESLNSSTIYSKKNTYKKEQNMILLQDIALAKGNDTPQVRVRYVNYDCYGNPAYLIKDETEHSVYLWGYNGQYPIAKIDNVNYATVKAALGGVTPDALAKQVLPNMTLVDALRVALSQASVYTYTYRPHVGVVTETSPQNVTLHYEYDLMNRLKYIRDMYGNILKTFDYQYKR